MCTGFVSHRMMVMRAFARRLLVAGACTAITGNASEAASEAKRRFEEGKALYRRAHDIEGARAKFAQAYSLEPRPEVLWNLAICELEAGHAEEAILHFRSYARDPEARASLVELLPELLAKARANLGALRIVAPPEAAVRIDGRAIEPREWQAAPLDLAPGDRVLAVELHGERFEDIVTVQRGGTLERRFPLPRPDAPSTAPAYDPSSPDHAVPASAFPAPGPSTPPEPLPPETPEAEPAPASSVLPIILASLGLASLGAGAYFAFESHADADAADSARATVGGLDCRLGHPGGCTRLRDALDSGRRNAWLSVGSYGAAAAFAGAAAWLHVGEPGGRGVRAAAWPGGAVLRLEY